MKKKTMRNIGISMMACGLAVLAVFAYRKISRELYLKKLLDTCIVLEIPSIGVKVPVQEGTDNEALAVSAGHFPGTGALGKGNYCLAGHNSTIYAEIFNELDKISIGDDIILLDNNAERTEYRYIVTDYTIVPPSATYILNDFGDDRVTIVSCTDDGKDRQVVVGMKKEQP